jgi:uncharacterized protein (TIGR02246 family)
MRRTFLASLSAILVSAAAAAAEPGAAPVSKPAAGARATGKVDLAAEEAAVRAIVQASMGAWDRKDLAWFEASSAHDADQVNFGTDAAEYWVGWDAVRAAVKAQFAALSNARFTCRDVRVKVHPSGAVAWATYLWDGEGTSGGEPFSLKGVRATIIYEKRGGKWLAVSSHYSVPVSGQSVKY